MQVPKVYLKKPYTDTLMILSSAKEPDKNKLVIVSLA